MICMKSLRTSVGGTPSSKGISGETRLRCSYANIRPSQAASEEGKVNIDT